MALGDGHRTPGPELLSGYPEVNLEWTRDGGRDPPTLTIFDPATERLATSSKTDACGDLERMR